MKLTLVYLACLLAVAVAAPGLMYISVSNGATDGTWRGFEVCPPKTGAGAFNLKVDTSDPWDPFYDSTNVNAIRLHCDNGKDPEETIITSGQGRLVNNYKSSLVN